MLTANTNYLEAREPVDVVSGGFLDKMKEMLKYARNINFPTKRSSTIEMTEATLRDIGISKHQLRGMSDKYRFDDELDRLRVQGSMYMPR